MHVISKEATRQFCKTMTWGINRHSYPTKQKVPLKQLGKVGAEFSQDWMFSKTVECCLNCCIFFIFIFNRDGLFLSVIGMLFFWLFYIYTDNSQCHVHLWMPYASYPWSLHSASHHYGLFLDTYQNQFSFRNW